MDSLMISAILLKKA